MIKLARDLGPLSSSAGLVDSLCSWAICLSRARCSARSFLENVRTTLTGYYGGRVGLDEWSSSIYSAPLSLAITGWVAFTYSLTLIGAD
jgi:hypothetical protein